MAYHRLIGEGETNLKPYWDASKRLTHLAHGSKGDDGKWESIGEDHQPLNLHAELEGSLNTASHLTIPKHDALKPLHHLAKTAKFVKCFCPSCILDNHIHPASSVYDVQHHITAATSKDPALRDAYYHAYPVGYHERIGDRVSNLGPIGKRTPHRAYWLSGDAEKYVHHAVKHSQDEQHKLYSGVDVAIPFDVPKLDINLIAEQTSRGEFRPSWMDEN